MIKPFTAHEGRKLRCEHSLNAWNPESTQQQHHRFWISYPSSAQHFKRLAGSSRHALEKEILGQLFKQQPPESELLECWKHSNWKFCRPY
jgi:hypothetical protein